MEVHCVNIKTAFLHGILEEEIYMEQLEGYVKKGEKDKVCRLLKSIYSLKQAGRQWFKHLANSMKNWDFSERIAGDVALFSKTGEGGATTIVLVYMDDMSIFVSNMELINDFKTQLGEQYQFSDMGEIHHYLGLRIT